MQKKDKQLPMFEHGEDETPRCAEPDCDCQEETPSEEELLQAVLAHPRVQSDISQPRHRARKGVANRLVKPL